VEGNLERQGYYIIEGVDITTKVDDGKDKFHEE
jgi:hypothetical protein